MVEVIKKLEITTLNVNLADENRLRFLALELAKGIYEPNEILDKLGWTEQDYEEIANSRVFKSMLRQYISEWRGAGNTKKRVQLKSIINIEAALPDFYTAMINPNEPLMARVKTLEILSKLGGLGGSEPPVSGGNGGNGQYFKLEIHMDRGAPPIIIDGGPTVPPMSGDSMLSGVGVLPQEFTPESKQIDGQVELPQSELLADQPWEEL